MVKPIGYLVAVDHAAPKHFLPALVKGVRGVEKELHGSSPEKKAIPRDGLVGLAGCDQRRPVITTSTRRLGALHASRLAAGRVGQSRTTKARSEKASALILLSGMPISRDR